MKKSPTEKDMEISKNVNPMLLLWTRNFSTAVFQENAIFEMTNLGKTLITPQSD